jgi:hypothetical protein
MLIPEKRMHDAGTRDYDPTMEGLAKTNAKAYSKGDLLLEGDLILCKTEKQDKAWYLAEIDKIYPDEIEVTYYSTPRPNLENYETGSKEQRMETLAEARFRKTWYIRQGKNAGMGTRKAPFPQNPEQRLWNGKLPLAEAEDLILAVGITLDPTGLLSKGSLQLASNLDVGYEALETHRGGQGRAASRTKASQRPVLLRGDQALRLYEMQKDFDKERQQDKEKKNNNDLTPSLNPGSILSKQHSVVQRPC